MSEVLNQHIEELVDKHGLITVLSTLADVCFDKSSHILMAYNDKPLADAWERDAERINKLALVVNGE